jgi:hypothetical protein
MPHASPSHSLASGARPVDTSSGWERRTLLLGLTTGFGMLSAGGVTAAGVAVAGWDLGDDSQAESVSIVATNTKVRVCVDLTLGPPGADSLL